jgi:hypothetical protein
MSSTRLLEALAVDLSPWTSLTRNMIQVLVSEDKRNFKHKIITGSELSKAFAEGRVLGAKQGLFKVLKGENK